MLEPLSLDEAFGVVREAGIGAVELLGEPDRYERGELERALERHGLAVTGLTAAARLPTGRDLAHPDPRIRQRTLEHLVRCVELASQLGARFVGVAPSAVGRHWSEDRPERERAWLVAGLVRLAEQAERHGVVIGLEVLNRYATPTITTVEAALELLEEAGDRPIGVVVDLFHAAIEERSIPDAIRAAGPRLVDVQVADTTREGPGRGSLDFEAIARALVDADYRGPLALEAFPRGCGAFPTVGAEHVLESIAFVREMLPFFSALGLIPAARRNPAG
jgi:D-psicose/D-tagatose/L-ribulose 3-epimerase